MEAQSDDATKPAPTCPFLARSAASGTDLCLSQSSDVITVSSSYVASFCLTGRHVDCARFVQADLAVKDRLLLQRRAAETLQLRRVDETIQLPGRGADIHAVPDRVDGTAPVITSPSDNSSMQNGAVTVSGTAQPNHRVRLLDWLVPVGVATADDRGRWSMTLPSAQVGDHVYKAEMLDAAGNVVAVSNLCRMTVAPTAVQASGPAGLLHSLLRRRRVRRWLRRGAAALGIVVLLVAAYLLYTHRHAFTGAGGGAPVGSTSAPAPQAPRAARAWHFPALPAPSSQVSLLISNPGKAPVTVQLRVGRGGAAQRARVPASGGSNIKLSGRAGSGVLDLSSSGPVVVQRLASRGAAVQSSFGTPGP